MQKLAFQQLAIAAVFGCELEQNCDASFRRERTVIGKHVLRNSLLPVITLLGLSLPFLVSGAVITEAIFTWSVA